MKSINVDGLLRVDLELRLPNKVLCDVVLVLIQNLRTDNVSWCKRRRGPPQQRTPD